MSWTHSEITLPFFSPFYRYYIVETVFPISGIP